MSDLPEEVVEALKKRWPASRRKDGIRRTWEESFPIIAIEAVEEAAPAIRKQERERVANLLGEESDRVANLFPDGSAIARVIGLADAAEFVAALEDSDV